MRKWVAPVSIAFLACFFLFASGRAQTFSNADYEQYLDGVAGRIGSVWDGEIRQSILSLGFELAPGEPRLEISRDCHWRAYYDPSATPPTVSYGIELLHFSSYLQQATLLYLLGMPGFDDPLFFDGYVYDVVLPRVAQAMERCVRAPSGPDRDRHETLPSIASHAGLAQAEYSELMAKAAAMTRAGELADYVAGFPVFFVLLHEAGHHVVHRDATSYDPRMEAEADGFAASVFEASEVPVTLGIGHFLLFSMGRSPEPDQDLACRIAALAEGDRNIRSHMRAFPQLYALQAERLRDHLAARYGRICIGEE